MKETKEKLFSSSLAARRFNKLLLSRGCGTLEAFLRLHKKNKISSYRVSRILSELFPEEEVVPSSTTIRNWWRRLERKEEKSE